MNVKIRDITCCKFCQCNGLCIICIKTLLVNLVSGRLFPQRNDLLHVRFCKVICISVKCQCYSICCAGGYHAPEYRYRHARCHKCCKYFFLHCKFPPFVCFFVLNMVILYKTAFGKSMDFCLIQHVLFSFFTFFHLFVQFSLFLFRCSYKIDTRNLPEERS